MSECPGRAALERYLTGAAEPAEGEAIGTHVEACPRCLERLAWLDSMLDDPLLDGVRRKDPSFPPEDPYLTRLIETIASRRIAPGDY